MEEDVEEVLRYFGRYFVIKPDKKKSPLLVFGDSYGDSQNPIQITYRIGYVLLKRETGFDVVHFSKLCRLKLNANTISCSY